MFLSHSLDKRTEDGDCSDGELRLQNGSSVREGRAEICVNRAWGTICNHNYGITDAQTICLQQTFAREGQTTLLPAVTLIYLSEASSVCTESQSFVVLHCLDFSQKAKLPW